MERPGQHVRELTQSEINNRLTEALGAFEVANGALMSLVSEKLNDPDFVDNGGFDQLTRTLEIERDVALDEYERLLSLL